MSVAAIPHDHARRAYDVFASFYDDFTADHDYDGWVGKVEAMVRELGVPGRAVLDLACGTGSSFAPLTSLGYTITATDVSPAMAAEASRKGGGRVPVLVEDMRELPVLGSFDLVWCLGEAVNYLHSRQELAAAFAGVRRNLREGGLFVFDAVTLGAFRSIFSSLSVTAGEDRVLVLDGKGSPDLREGGTAEVCIERLVRDDERRWRREKSVHLHRHHPERALRAALEGGGFHVEAVRGTLPGEPLDPEPDALRHQKLVIAARCGRASSGRR
jgi:SAM-dependent methyltransferase